MADKASRSRTAQLASGGILFSVPFSTTRPLTAASPLNPLRCERVEGKSGGRGEGQQTPARRQRSRGGGRARDNEPRVVSEDGRLCIFAQNARVIALPASLPPFRPSPLPLSLSRLIRSFRRFRCVQAFASRDCTTMMIISI